MFEYIIYKLYIYKNKNNTNDIRSSIISKYIQEYLAFSGSGDIALLDSSSFDFGLGPDYFPLSINCIDAIGTGEGSDYCGVPKILGYDECGTHYIGVQHCKKLVCPSCGIQKRDQSVLDISRKLWDYYTLNPGYHAHFLQIRVPVPPNTPVSAADFSSFMDKKKAELRKAGFVFGSCIPTFLTLKPEVAAVLHLMGYSDCDSYTAARDPKKIEYLNSVCGCGFKSWRDLFNFTPILQVVAFSSESVDCSAFDPLAWPIDLSDIDSLVDSVLFAANRMCAYDVDVTKFKSFTWIGSRGSNVVEEAEAADFLLRDDPRFGREPTLVQSAILCSMERCCCDVSNLHVGVFEPKCQDDRSPYEKIKTIDDVKPGMMVPWGRFIIRRRYEPGVGWVYNPDDAKFNEDFVNRISDHVERARISIEFSRLDRRWADPDIDILNKSLPFSEVPRFSKDDRVKRSYLKRVSWPEYLDLYGHRARREYSSSPCIDLSPCTDFDSFGSGGFYQSDLSAF